MNKKTTPGREPVEVRLKNGAMEVLTIKLYQKCSNFDSKGNKLDSFCEQPEKLRKWAKLLKYQIRKEELVESKVHSLGKKDPNAKRVEKNRYMQNPRRCSVCGKSFHPVIGSELPYICPICSEAADRFVVSEAADRFVVVEKASEREAFKEMTSKEKKLFKAKKEKERDIEKAAKKEKEKAEKKEKERVEKESKIQKASEEKEAKKQPETPPGNLPEFPLENPPEDLPEENPPKNLSGEEIENLLEDESGGDLEDDLSPDEKDALLVDDLEDTEGAGK